MLEAGADANIKDTDANFPLILACFVGDVTVVQMLLSAGANVDVEGYRFEVLKANNRRAERVRVTKITSNDD